MFLCVEDLCFSNILSKSDLYKYYYHRFFLGKCLREIKRKRCIPLPIVLSNKDTPLLYNLLLGAWNKSFNTCSESTCFNIIYHSDIDLTIWQYCTRHIS